MIRVANLESKKKKITTKVNSPIKASVEEDNKIVFVDNIPDIDGVSLDIKKNNHKNDFLNLIISNKKKIVFYIPWFLLAVFLITSFYFWFRLNSVSNNLQNNPNTEISNLVKQVGGIILLPSKELPQVATINDLTNIKKHPFFKNALIGDKVLIYSKEKKVILYRPSKHIIVEEMSLDINNSTSSSSVI